MNTAKNQKGKQFLLH